MRFDLPKNPWIWGVVIGGIVILVIVIVRSINGVVNNTATTAENAPGNLIKTTITDTGDGIKSLWNTLIYNPISSLFAAKPAPAAPSAGSTTTTGSDATSGLTFQPVSLADNFATETSGLSLN